MRFIIFLGIILIILLIFLIFRDKTKPTVDDRVDALNMLAEEVIIDTVTKSKVKDPIERLAQATVVDHTLGDAELANNLYAELVNDLFAGDLFHVIQVGVHPARFNDIVMTVTDGEIADGDFTVKSDSNNVHDGALLDRLVSKYDRLRHLNGKIDVGRATISLTGEVERLDDYPIEAVVAKMLEGNPFSRFNDNELNILLHVWVRVQNNKDLRDPFFDALRDGFNKNSNVPHCITGRVSRLLECFTSVDPDPTLGGGGATLDIIRNEMYNRSGALMQQLDAKVMEAYNRGDEEADAYVKNMLESRLTEEYGTLTDPKRLSKIINDITASLM